MGKKIIGVVCAVFLFLMLISMVNATWVYQEDANQTDSAGALTDGNWDTFITFGDLLMNYTKPTNSLNTSLWQVKDYGGIFNLTIPQSCWDLDANKILFRMATITSSGERWYCETSFDEGGTWELLRSDNGDTGDSYSYEEAMIWNITEAGDSTPPYFTTIPANAEVEYGTNWNGVYFNATDETGFGTYSINDTTHFSINSTGFFNWTGQLSVGNYYVNITINDTSNNLNSTVYNLNITDSTSPGVVINSPLNKTYSSISTLFNITATDNLNVSSCRYSLNGGTTNLSLTRSGNYWTATNSSMTQGSHQANFYCNDTSGNFNNTEKVTFFIDSISPLLLIISPSEGYNIPNYVSGSVPVLANFSLTETNPSSCWYTTNSGATNTTVTCSAGYNNFTFYLSSAGTFTLKIYSNDSAGNSGSDQVNISMTAYSGPQKGSGSTGYETPSINDSASLNMTDLPEDFQDYNKTLMCKNIGEFIIEHPTINETDKQNLMDILSLELGFGVSGEVVDYYLENYQGVCIGDQPLDVIPEKSSDKNSTAWIIIFVVGLSIVAIVVVSSSKKK